MKISHLVKFLSLTLSLSLAASCTDLPSEPLPLPKSLTNANINKTPIEPLSELLATPSPGNEITPSANPVSEATPMPSANSSKAPFESSDPLTSPTPQPEPLVSPSADTSSSINSKFKGDPNQLASLIVAPSFQTIAHIGESGSFFVLAKDVNGQFIDPNQLDIKWSVEDPDLYSIDNTGKVTTLMPSGYTTVKASSNGFSASAEVTMGSSGGRQIAATPTPVPAPPVVPEVKPVPFFDFNGDGFEDLLVGARKGDGDATDSGQVYVFYGPLSSKLAADTTAASADIVINGKATDDNFGANLTSGDINGDGITDIITTAHTNDGLGTNSGEVYIFYGTKTPTSTLSAATASVTIAAEADKDQFGRSVVAKDINKDGVADLLIGASHFDPGGNGNRGRIYGFYGSAGFNATTGASANFTIDGAANNDQLGRTIALGDVDGDSFLDIITSSTGTDTAGNRSGTVYVFKGSNVHPASRTAAADAFMTVTGETADDRLGEAVTSGDINGDGKADIIIASDRFNGDAGRVYAFYGTATPTANQSVANANFIVDAEAAGNRLGRGLISGDISGDGIDDLIIGAPRFAFNGKTNAGMVYIFNGSATLAGTVSASTAPSKVTIDDNGNQFGAAITLGYMNTDSVLDLIVGVYADDTIGSQSGSVRIFFGNSSAWANPLLAANDNITIQAANVGDHFGRSVHAGSPAIDEEEDT